MDNENMEAILVSVMSEYWEGEADVVTFDDDGLLTNNKGITVRTPDGKSEFQLTIVQTR